MLDDYAHAMQVKLCKPNTQGLTKIIEIQKTDVGVFHIKRKMKEQETKNFRLDERGVLWFEDRLVVPKDHEHRNQILDEAH